jgi:hypothetical protein
MERGEMFRKGGWRLAWRNRRTSAARCSGRGSETASDHADGRRVRGRYFDADLDLGRMVGPDREIAGAGYLGPVDEGTRCGDAPALHGPLSGAPELPPQGVSLPMVAEVARGGLRAGVNMIGPAGDVLPNIGFISRFLILTADDPCGRMISVAIDGEVLAACGVGGRRGHPRLRMVEERS